MKTINLEQIVDQLIETKGMVKKDIASHLFPENKYPELALNRVMKGESHLDALQISKLSLLSEIPIDELFGDWKMKSSSGYHILTSENYRAEIDMSDMTVRLFDKESMFHEEIIFDTKITITELIGIINIQISNYESN